LCRRKSEAAESTYCSHQVSLASLPRFAHSCNSSRSSSRGFTLTFTRLNARSRWRASKVWYGVKLGKRIHCFGRSSMRKDSAGCFGPLNTLHAIIRVERSSWLLLSKGVVSEGHLDVALVFLEPPTSPVKALVAKSSYALLLGRPLVLVTNPTTYPSFLTFRVTPGTHIVLACLSPASKWVSQG
jgi:hypothetical protein